MFPQKGRLVSAGHVAPGGGLQPGGLGCGAAGVRAQRAGGGASLGVPGRRRTLGILLGGDVAGNGRSCLG